MVEPKAAHRRRGTAHHNAKLTPDLVRQIRQAHAEGASFTGLARVHGVNRTTIEKVVRREVWRDV